MPPTGAKKVVCDICGDKVWSNNIKKHVEACLKKQQGVAPRRLQFVLAPQGSGYTNDDKPCGTCGRYPEYKLILCPETNALCAPCAFWGDPNKRHLPYFTLDDRRLENREKSQDLRALSGSRIVQTRGDERIDWSLEICEESGMTLEDTAREFVVTAPDDSWRTGGDPRQVARAHPSVERFVVTYFGDMPAEKTAAILTKLRMLQRRDLPKTYSGESYPQFSESMNILAVKKDPMFSYLPAATAILVASVVQGNIVLNRSALVRACRPVNRRAAQGAQCRSLVSKAASRAYHSGGDEMLALVHRNQLLAGVVTGGANEWRDRWGHEGDDSFGLRCRKDGLQVIMTRGSQLYHTATLDEDTLAGCSFGGKGQRATVLQAFNSIDRDNGDNIVGQAYLSLPYTRPQAQNFSSALLALRSGDVVMLHVGVHASRVIELGPIRGGESRDADLVEAYHVFGRLFDPDVYAQRSASSAETFVRGLLYPDECSGILISGLDMGGIVKLRGETEWCVIGRDCVKHPLDAEICTALDRTLARRVLDLDWTLANVPQDDWTGETVMRRENLVKVMPRADDAYRIHRIFFGPLLAALNDDEADATAVLEECWGALKQGCATMGPERFMAHVREVFQAKHADDIARELLRPREVIITSVDIHNDDADLQERVVLVERQGLDGVRGALAARLAAREAQPRNEPASELGVELDAKVSSLPPAALAGVAQALDGDARPRMRPQPPQSAFDDTELVFACVEVKYTNPTGRYTGRGAAGGGPPEQPLASRLLN